MTFRLVTDSDNLLHMTDASATPQPKPSHRGGTPPGSKKNRPKNFPVQVTYMFPGDLAKAIEDDATRETAALGRKVSKSEIARRYAQAGRALTDAAERSH